MSDQIKKINYLVNLQLSSLLNTPIEAFERQFGLITNDDIKQAIKIKKENDFIDKDMLNKIDNIYYSINNNFKDFEKQTKKKNCFINEMEKLKKYQDDWEFGEYCDKLISEFGQTKTEDATFTTGEEIKMNLKKKIKPNWLIKGLDLEPGTAAILYAPSGRGKTYFTTHLACCVLTGLPAFGKFPVRKGKIAHLNWDGMSNEHFFIQFQRTLFGMSIDTDTVAADIRYAKPRWKMTDDDAIEKLYKVVEGCAFAVIDSLRMCYDGDENDSEANIPIEVASRVSEMSGCTILFVAHSGKDETKGIRGSSAFQGAGGTIIQLSGKKGENKNKISQSKSRMRGFQDFYAVWHDIGEIDEDLDLSKGTVLTYQEIAEEEKVEKSDADKILEIVAKNDGMLNKTSLANLLDGNEKSKYNLINSLINDGRLIINSNKKLTIKTGETK